MKHQCGIEKCGLPLAWTAELRAGRKLPLCAGHAERWMSGVREWRAELVTVARGPRRPGTARALCRRYGKKVAVLA